MIRVLRLVPIILGLASPVLAQETIRPDMTLRLATSRGIIMGRVLASTGEMLTIDSAGRRAVTLPWTAVSRVERRQSRAGSWAVKGAITGAVVGALYGSLVVLGACDTSNCESYLPVGAGVGGLGLGTLGAGVGAALGSTRWRWTPVAIRP